MSASPIARQATQSQSIPSRHVVINDASQLPMDYSTTPGGTLYSTTPGGTRIVYDRSFLLQLRNSPVARTPPKNLPVIPGITAPSDATPQLVKANMSMSPKKASTQNNEDVGQEQFQLEI